MSQELEKQCAAQQELESKLKLMRNRLKARGVDVAGARHALNP